MTVTQVMSIDHRQCDEQLTSVAEAIQNNNWKLAEAEMALFTKAILSHFEFEEQNLFVAFEQATGMTQGPTKMMRIEHDEIREILDSLTDTVINRQADNFYGLYETLNIFLQQHNMKEEGVLYPMIDQECKNPDELVETIAEKISNRAA